MYPNGPRPTLGREAEVAVIDGGPAGVDRMPADLWG